MKQMNAQIKKKKFKALAQFKIGFIYKYIFQNSNHINSLSWHCPLSFDPKITELGIYNLITSSRINMSVKSLLFTEELKWIDLLGGS
jgi:hypothetical protein